MSICITTALFICCAPFVAQAERQDTPPPPPSHHHQVSPDELALRMLVRHLVLQRYDADKNGHLDAPEREHLRRETREALHHHATAVATKFDHDKDGMLSPEEREEMRRSFRARRKNQAGHPAPKHPHANKKGDRPNKPHRKHRGSRRMGKFAREMAFISHRLMLQAYDEDGSGQLEAQEMNICRQDAAKLYEKRKSELLHRYDSDQDGQLSEHEHNKGRTELLPPPPSGEQRRPRLSPETLEDLALLRHLFHSACSPSTN